MAANTDDHNRDSRLVQSALAGDRAAFGALVAAHRPLLLALCRRALGDDGLAEDAAQEAIVQAMLSLDRLRRPDRFGSWLAGIGLNICHRWQRREARAGWSWEAMLGGRTLPEPVDPAPAVDIQAEAAELQRWVHAAVAALPAGQRSAVTLHYLAGLTQAETADLLGISPGAVKTRLHKGRARLRRTLWLEAMENVPDPGGTAMVTMKVTDVRRRRRDVDADEPDRHFVVLDEAGGPRRLLIWIGGHEATALALHLEGTAVPRPLSYALMAGVLQAAGGRLHRVRIDRLEGDTYYATLEIDSPAGRREVDARPSDALNLALVADAPIVVEDALVSEMSEHQDNEWWRRIETDYADLTEGPAAIVADLISSWSTSSSHEPPDEAAPPA